MGVNGGAGGLNGTHAGGAGGSGIVVISYHTDGSDGVSPSSTGGTITTSGNETIHTFTSSGTFTVATSTYTTASSTVSTPIISTLTFSYDQNGNLISDGTWTHTWDYQNRLTQSSKTGTTTSSTYGPTTERVKHTEGGITTFYPTKYYNTDGTTPQKHIFTLATIRGTGVNATPSYSHLDHLGGVTTITNKTGSLTELSDYYPYGDYRIDWNYTPTTSEQRTYAGTEYDPTTMLSYMQARYYEGGRGQFLSQDPVFWEVGQTSDGKTILTNPQLANSYSYAGNNPINGRDPSGRMFVVDDLAGFGIGGLVGAGVYGLSSIVAGENVSWSGASGAFVTGGIIGWGAVNTPETLGASNAVSAAVISGAIGGFYGDATKQMVDIGTGKQSGGLNYSEMNGSAVAAGISGGVLQKVLPGAKIPGLSSGRGNMNATGEGMKTKATNGTIKNMSANTAIKSAIGSQASDAYRTIGGAGVDAINSLSSNKKK